MYFLVKAQIVVEAGVSAYGPQAVSSGINTIKNNYQEHLRFVI